LRLLRSEIQRLRAHDGKYQWEDRGIYDTTEVPVAPVIVSAFAATIADIDWSLTDSPVSDDRMHEKLADIEAAVGVLGYLEGQIRSWQTHLGDEDRRLQAEQALTFVSKDYDKIIDRLVKNTRLITVDLDRRLRYITPVEQLKRGLLPGRWLVRLAKANNETPIELERPGHQDHGTP
jgi:hypothetical protein